MGQKLKIFEILIILTSLAFIVQSYSNLLCPTNTVQKRNNLTQQTVQLPSTLSYAYSGIFRNGNLINEMSVRIQNQRVYLAVVYKELNVVQQYKQYTTPIQIVAVKNQIAIIKVFTADRSSYSYDVLKFDGTKNTSPQIAITWSVNLPWLKDAGGNSLAGLSIKKLLNYRQQTLTLAMIVSSTTTAYFYALKVDTGVLTKKSKINTSTLPNIVGGYDRLIFDDVSDKFYDAFNSDFNFLDLTTFFGVKTFYYTNVYVSELQNNHTIYFSKDPASTKSTLFLDRSNGTTSVSVLAPGTKQARFYSDKLMNFIAYSDQMIYWFCMTQFTPEADIIIYQQKGSTAFAGIDQIIADFNNSLSISTNGQMAFVLNATSMKYYKIYAKSAGLNVIQKIHQLTLTENLKTQLAQPATSTGQLVVLTLKCQCVAETVPHMVCFSQTYSCIIAMRKDFIDCTTY